MKKTHASVTGGSPLRTYQEVIVGRPGWLALVYFEWCAWLAPVPGAGGLLLRKLFWPRLFAACGRGVVFGANVVLRQPGRIRLGEHVGVNARTIIQSTSGCPVDIGRDCIIGQSCLIIGGGSYDLSDPDALIREQPIRRDGGVTLEENVWLGGKVSVLGGVRVGRGSVVAAGAVVSRSLPADSVAMGVPAAVVRSRR